MATMQQIADWKAAGEAVQRAREQARDGLASRPADEVSRLREQAAESAACCADCFTPLAPDQSVTLVSRIVAHVPARYNPLGHYIPAQDRWLSVPICLPCWLTSIVTLPSRMTGIPGVHLRAHAEDYPEPLASPWQVVRLRCESCGRPLRVESKRGRWLPLRQRCCCAVCLRSATRSRANERRRVRHHPIRCAVCRKQFIPTQSTAKTCSNRCRQALHRRRHRRRDRRRPLQRASPRSVERWRPASVVS